MRECVCDLYISTTTTIKKERRRNLNTLRYAFLIHIFYLYVFKYPNLIFTCVRAFAHTEANLKCSFLFWLNVQIFRENFLRI